MKITPCEKRQHAAGREKNERLQTKPKLLTLQGAWHQVYSGFKIAFWYQYLEQYEDKIVLDFLHFGWPINFYSEVFPISTICNHPSATSVAIWGLIAI